MSMDYKNIWEKAHASVCSIRHMRNEKAIVSGSGFMVGGLLVTNNHLFCPQNESGAIIDSDYVEVMFTNIDGSVQRGIRIEREEWSKSLCDGMEEASWDYAILDIPSLKVFPSLVLAPEDEVIQIGCPIALLGYQFGELYLSMHSGIVSALFKKRNGVCYIRVDASINHGNSGGPLLSLDSGHVIGIVTRSNKALTKTFSKLSSILNNNIEQLKKVTGMIGVGAFDPVKGMLVIQRQLDVTVNQIKRSANVGVGYAFALDKIREYFANLQ